MEIAKHSNFAMKMSSSSKAHPEILFNRTFNLLPSMTITS